MEHYKLIKKIVEDKVDIKKLSLNYVRELFSKAVRFICIVDGGRYIGCIGWREYERSMQQNQVIINRDSVFLRTSENEKEEAKRLFDTMPYVRRIPVLDADDRLLYEYECDREGFYSDLVIECGINREKKRREKVIVSLTSYGKRLETVYITIKSIMYQTMKPDAIVLYLDESSGNDSIVREEELVRAGLTIRRNVENLKPHTKYYYAMQEFEEALIVTVDDDIIYDDGLIEDLYLHHVKFPEAVICRRGHGMTKQDSRIAPYKKWEGCVKTDYPTNALCPTGVGGVLYPCGEYRKAFLDRETLIKNALTADDIWLKAIQLLNGVKAYAIGEVPLKMIHDTQAEALQLLNVDQGENDAILNNLQNHFSADFAEFI